MNCFYVDLLQGTFFFQKKEEEEINVRVVCFDSIFRKAFLGDKVVEKKLFCRNKLLWEGFFGDG